MTPQAIRMEFSMSRYPNSIIYLKHPRSPNCESNSVWPLRVVLSSAREWRSKSLQSAGVHPLGCWCPLDTVFKLFKCACNRHVRAERLANLPGAY